MTVQRTLLPGFYDRYDFVRDGADRTRRDFNAVQFFQVSGNVSITVVTSYSLPLTPDREIFALIFPTDPGC